MIIQTLSIANHRYQICNDYTNINIHFIRTKLDMCILINNLKLIIFRLYDNNNNNNCYSIK